MTYPRISAPSLLRETFAVVGSVYPDLLRINSPHLIWFVLNTFGPDALNRIIEIIDTSFSEHPGAGTFSVKPIYFWLGTVPFLIYWLVAVPLLWGATTFYTYRSLTKNQVTASDAFIQAKRRFLPLLLVYFLSVGLLFAIRWFLWSFVWVSFLVPIIIIPALYVLYPLIFSAYATVIDNSSVPDSLGSSWKLTKGRWWLIFRSNLLMAFVFFVPAILISGLIGSTLGNLLASQLVGQVLGFIAGVLINVYLILLYKALRESAATIE
ncbi:hypothetical protein [Microcoleus sp. N9_A1]|uniref:hypothetical protein n=1 Tax=Microcoleus sp. N9_A1 TaxID=3055380 RepID=UPI002FD00683